MRTATRRRARGLTRGGSTMEEHPMSRTRRGAPAVLAALALALAVPAIAAAATKPGVSTLGAAKVTITTATLTGKVNPHGAATTYYFQYGTTTAYGSRTPSAGVGAGTAAVGATADDRRARAEHEVPLPPRRAQQRRHHDRRRRAFTTPKQPLGLALAATPNPVAFGAPSTLAGTLSAPATRGARSSCSRSRSRSRPPSPTSATPSSRTPRAPSRSRCSRSR